MRGHILLSILLVFGAAQGRRQPGGGSSGSSAAPTAAPTTTSSSGNGNEATYGSVIAQQNPTDSVASNSNCGDAAEGYYEEYTTADTRYIVASGAPSHAAEYNQDHANPNTRCERWQYIAVPLEWSASGSDYQALGVVGYVMSGGTVYDHRSSPTGDLASFYEWDSLDPSFGHSDNNNQYHYHAVPNESDYEYTASSSCLLDNCNMMEINGEMAYVMTPNYPYVPPCLKGEAADINGFTPDDLL